MNEKRFIVEVEAGNKGHPARTTQYGAVFYDEDAVNAPAIRKAVKK